ncbi:MAG: 2-succinyl-5-enolpyruvyl-6-hydroxy-3-cyclohexene-1-carboxylic-acid synthase, partial [Bacteroidota bacterium]|nr:2-succinyl-5-enolpyruvyl-6-hydroxy-3-cyclohexene-1-carboxylic-acid synthase [Bacteroidota bacterium]
MKMQAVYNIAEICARHGITDVVLSPGSRSAPLTLAFARHPDLNVRVVPDERAAAFIGLGIAQAQRRAVALVCTSGTAGLNYAPAIAEAFFQQIPLVIFTADRPPEWIDQLDGQTIRQHNLYGAHAKGAFEFPVDTSHPDAKWHSARMINEAINLAQAAPAGPVQVNVPLREPFYPKEGEAIGYEKDVKIVLNVSAKAERVGFSLYQELKAIQRIVVVVGQQPADAVTTAAVAKFAAVFGAPVITDTIANIASPVSLCGSRASHDAFYPDVSSMLPKPFEQVVTHHDVFLAGLSAAGKEALRPDLLITFGQSLISKSLKLFLRDAKPAQHWHIQAEGPVADTFRCLTRTIRSEPAQFFAQWAQAELPARATLHPWQQADTKAAAFLASLFNGEAVFNEFSASKWVLNALLARTALHLANSMAVRYANILGIPQGKQIEVFSNRGTSGIDGCTSTAVGAALAQPERPVVLLTGDVAFFYDRNAFWHNYPLPNLRVVLFN